MFKLIQNIIFFLMAGLLLACNDDFLNPEKSEYYKIFYGASDLEAVDFVAKNDDSGYLILANSKTSTDSDLYLIVTDENGYEEHTSLINTPEFYDEGVTLKILNDHVYLLGTRKSSAESNNFESVLLKISNQLIAENNIVKEEDISFITLTNTSAYSMKMNDFVFVENNTHIIFGGIVEENRETNEIVQIYAENQTDVNDETGNKIIPIQQFPNNFTFDTTSVLRVFNDTEAETFTTVGQNFAANDSTSIATETRNIRRKIYRNKNVPAGNPIKVYAVKDVQLGAALKEAGTSTYYYAGNHLTNDSLFIIRDILISSDNPENIKNSQSIQSFFVDEGHQVVSMGQKRNKDIIIATTNSNSGIENGVSSLLKFSASGVQIDKEYVEFQSSNLYNVKKIVVDKEDKVIILSSLAFENDARAVGLTKITF